MRAKYKIVAYDKLTEHPNELELPAVEEVAFEFSVDHLDEKTLKHLLGKDANFDVASSLPLPILEHDSAALQTEINQELDFVKYDYFLELNER